jgi:PA-IL-like protein
LHFRLEGHAEVLSSTGFAASLTKGVAVMTHRLSFIAVGALLAAALVSARAEVTFVLRDGQRQSGQLTHRVGTGDLGVTVDGRERMFQFEDIAMIQFMPGDPPKAELEKLPTADNPPERERHMLVLRSGETMHGKYHGFDGDQMTFDVWNSSGGVDRRTVSLGSVARLYVSAPGSRSVFNTILSSPQSVANKTVVRVEANRTWTDTGILVRSGDRIAFSVSGQIQIAPRTTVGPDGDPNSPGRSSYPVRMMNSGGLVARVGNSAAFPIGGTANQIEMPATGRLLLGINDDNFRDNGGAFEVTIGR